jgi:predicted TPR repeat methyltransferase
MEAAKEKTGVNISQNLLFKLATKNIYSKEQLATIEFSEKEK